MNRPLPALAALLLAGPALAEESQWTIAPYVWIAGFEGTWAPRGATRTPGSDADFGNLWDNLALAGAMVNVNWRRDRWTAFGDWTYANVRSDSPGSVPALYESLEAQVKGHIVQALVGYDVRPRESGHLDLFAGARYYNLELSVDFSGGALAPAELEGTKA